MHLGCPLVSSETPETLSYSENVKKFEPRSRKIERTQETEAKFEFWQRKIFEKAANFVQFSSVRQLQFKETGNCFIFKRFQGWSLACISLITFRPTTSPESSGNLGPVFKARSRKKDPDLPWNCSPMIEVGPQLKTQLQCNDNCFILRLAISRQSQIFRSF